VTNWDAGSDEHGRFRELAAAATCGELTAAEGESLARHVQECEECASVLREYQILSSEGFAFLARSYEHRIDAGRWNDAAARYRLLDAVGEMEKPAAGVGMVVAHRFRIRRFAMPAALAACLLAGVGIGAWRFGHGQGQRSKLEQASIQAQLSAIALARQSAESELAAKAGELARLQANESAKHHEFEELQNQLVNMKARLAAGQAAVEELSQAKTRTEFQLSQVTLQRDQLTEQLHAARQAYDLVEAELNRIRSERDKAKLDFASLDARIDELTTLNQEQERHLKADDQYLASDRDIRDLMSARNLYIADVFDVDGHSRTRKPFGRVFYTRGKSMLFYAYDLDQQPQLKSAVTFQVWGQKETDQNQAGLPVDLGILYRDSEANRRWFMRFDDSRTLSEIDFVFVTVEPHGGSHKPTGKPFLFATLQKEANHP
jgi:hypothetical protein